MFSKVEGQDAEGRRLWKVLPSCHLKMTASQLKIETTNVSIEEAAPALIERIKQVDREGGHDELNHVFQLRKRHLFIFKDHLLHHVQIAGAIIWVKGVQGKSLFKLADGTEIIDCVYWHKLGNIDGKEQRSALDAITVVVSGKPDIYRDMVQIYVTRFNVLSDFEQEASFFSSLIRSHQTLFERDSSTPSPSLESRLYDENIPQH